MDEPSVWIVGDWRHADFASALFWLDRQTSCVRFDNAAAALASLRLSEHDRDPAAVLLVQSRPGQLTEQCIERLHAAVPLARLVALVGPWCEGEMRSGRPWSGVVRVPWRAWQSALPRALAIECVGDASAAPLPRTASETQRVETSVEAVAQADRFVGTAAIWTSSRTTFKSIAGALEKLGIRAHWQFAEAGAKIPPVDLVLCDGWEQIPPRERAAAPGDPASPPRLLLLDFPRPDDAARSADLGIAAVLAHPLLLADLSAALGRLLPHSETRVAPVR